MFGLLVVKEGRTRGVDVKMDKLAVDKREAEIDPEFWSVGIKNLLHERK